jgi:hypothetical protein
MDRILDRRSMINLPLCATLTAQHVAARRPTARDRMSGTWPLTSSNADGKAPQLQ